MAPKTETKSVMITGGCGSLGQHLANELAAMGLRPVLFGNTERRHLLRPGLEPGDCPFARGDVLNLPELMAAMDEYDIDSVVHSAAIIPPASEERPYHSIQVNIIGLVNVLEAVCRLKLGRVTLVSSGAVYAPEPADATEGSSIPLDMPFGLYGVTKASAEMIGLFYARRKGVDFITTRHAAIYGPGMGGAPHYLNRLVHGAVSGKPIRMPGGGDHRFEFVHVADSVKGLALIHTASGLKYRVYNIGSGRSTSLIELSELIKGMMPGVEIELGPGLVPELPQRRPFDINRAVEAGYRPRWDLESGLVDLVDSLEHEGK